MSDDQGKEFGQAALKMWVQYCETDPCLDNYSPAVLLARAMEMADEETAGQCLESKHSKDSALCPICDTSVRQKIVASRISERLEREK